MNGFLRAGLWLGLAAMAAAGCSSSDSGGSAATTASVEDFCKQVASKTCGALSGCCTGGTQFDPFECNRATLETCFSTAGAEQVHDGKAVFNSDAAAKCYGAPSGCPTLTTGSMTSDDSMTIACNSILTGFRPLGSGCSADSECAAVGSGAYPKCLSSMGSGSGGDGVCAKASFATDGQCGFFPDSDELHMCPNGADCVVTTSVSSSAQGKARFEFHGTCKPLAQGGEPCGSVGAGTVNCAAGFTCNYSSATPVCVKVKVKGDPCQSSSECSPLYCNPQTHVCDDGGVTVSSPYCYAYQGQGGSGGFGGSDGGECSTVGSGCADSSTCCAGLSCQSGYCLTASCKGEGNTCSMSSDCCSGLSCQSGYCMPPTTCAAQYQSCTSTSCCSGLTCNGSYCDTTPTCASQGYACSYDSDCCTSLTCQSGYCNPAPTCANQGYACTYTSDCCSGLSCQSGACYACYAAGSYVGCSTASYAGCCSGSCNTSTGYCN